MPETPTSSAARAIDGARQLIASSATYVTHNTTHHGAEAPLNSVYLNDVWRGETPLADLRPLVVVSLAEHAYNPLAQCSATSLVASGGIVVAFFDDSRFDDDIDSAIHFFNWMYGTLDDMQDRFGVDDNYPFTSIETLLPPDRPDIGRRQNDDFWFGAVRFGHERQ